MPTQGAQSRLGRPQEPVELRRGHQGVEGHGQGGRLVRGGDGCQGAQRGVLEGFRRRPAGIRHRGLDPDRADAGLERDLLLDRFEKHSDPARVAEHFAAHADRYARARLNQLVVATQGSARELLAQIRDEGRDFAELAREHSLHLASRLAGGSLGIVCRADLPANIADAVFAAEAGDVVGPLATEQGIHLFHVEALLPAELDEVTAARIREELFDAWVGEQLREVRIDLSWLETA